MVEKEVLALLISVLLISVLLILWTSGALVKVGGFWLVGCVCIELGTHRSKSPLTSPLNLASLSFILGLIASSLAS